MPPPAGPSNLPEGPARRALARSVPGTCLARAGYKSIRPAPGGPAPCRAAPAGASAPSPWSTVASRHRQRVRRRRRSFRRLLLRALAVSALLHGALLALWRAPPPPTPGSPAGEAAPSPAPPPAEALRAVDVRVRRAEAGEEAGRPVAARLPEAGRAPAAEPAANGLSLEPVPASGAPRLALAGEGPPASGRGSSGPEGDPSVVSPPVPRSLLPQWSPPEEVRGERVTVHVEVGPDGRPTGHVRLEPPTESERFNRRLREALTSIRYRPGTRAGSPVTAWAEITFVF